MTRGLARWVPALLWAGVIFIASAQTRLVHLPSLLGWDKLQHCAAYAVGGAAIAYALNAPPQRFAWMAVLLGSVYGVSDELHQYFVPGRSTDWRDWVADTVGAAAGVFLYRTYLTWRGRRGERAPALER